MSPRAKRVLSQPRAWSGAAALLFGVAAGCGDSAKPSSLPGGAGQVGTGGAMAVAGAGVGVGGASAGSAGTQSASGGAALGGSAGATGGAAPVIEQPPTIELAGGMLKL